MKPHESLYRGLNHGPFSSPQWIEAFKNNLLQPAYFQFKEKDNTIGSIAGLEILSSNSLARKLGLYKSLIFYTGPVVKKTEKIVDCIKSLNKKAKELGYFEAIYCSWDHLYKYPASPYPVQKPERTEYVIDLELGAECFYNKIKKNQRQVIKKGFDIGLKFMEDSSKEKLSLLDKMMNETRRIRTEKGYGNYIKYYIPFLSERVMENLVENKIMRLFHVELEGRVLSSMAVLSYGKKAQALFSGTNKEGYKEYANPFCYYKVGRKLIDEEKSYFNLGGVPHDNSGEKLGRFKLSFGAKGYSCTHGTSGFLQNKFYQIVQDIYNKIMISN
jgi:hypothetical protein